MQNEDELGELVHAFNKMKYATGEYIMALEEKRKTLDLLHEEELEKLETEKRLEMIKLELLKSQINPHFLFNTLNVISGMARLEEAQTTEKMILALSSLFRYNLKTPEQFVLLAKELNVPRIICICSRCASGSGSVMNWTVKRDRNWSWFRHLPFSRLWKTRLFTELRRRRKAEASVSWSGRKKPAAHSNRG